MKHRPHGLCYHILMSAFLAAVLYGCGSSAQTPSATPTLDATAAPNPPAVVTAAPTQQPEPIPTPAPAPIATPAPATPAPATPAPVSTPPTTITSNVPSGFANCVAESQRVDDSWFSTAAFIGDSRTEGLKAFSGLKYGDFLFSRGMNVFRVADEKYKVISIGGQDYTIMQALALKQYQSVYIMMGINELGYPVSSYRSGLSKLLEQVLAIQPNAVIYLQTLPPVNEAAAQKNNLSSSINNANVAAFNQVIAELAAQYNVALLDTAAAYQDANRSLPAELASDGVHFVPSAYRRWVDYMATHTLGS